MFAEAGCFLMYWFSIKNSGKMLRIWGRNLQTGSWRHPCQGAWDADPPEKAVCLSEEMSGELHATQEWRPGNTTSGQQVVEHLGEEEATEVLLEQQLRQMEAAEALLEQQMAEQRRQIKS